MQHINSCRSKNLLQKKQSETRMIQKVLMELMFELISKFQFLSNLLLLNFFLPEISQIVHSLGFFFFLMKGQFRKQIRQIWQNEEKIFLGYSFFFIFSLVNFFKLEFLGETKSPFDQKYPFKKLASPLCWKKIGPPIYLDTGRKPTKIRSFENSEKNFSEKFSRI